MFDHFSPESFVKINHLRGLPMVADPSMIWEPLFYGMDTGSVAQIRMKLRGEETKLEYSRDDFFVPTENMGIP